MPLVRAERSKQQQQSSKSNARSCDCSACMTAAPASSFRSQPTTYPVSTNIHDDTSPPNRRFPCAASLPSPPPPSSKANGRQQPQRQQRQYSVPHITHSMYLRRRHVNVLPSCSPCTCWRWHYVCGGASFRHGGKCSNISSKRSGAYQKYECWAAVAVELILSDRGAHLVHPRRL